jgi:hypothetical protein
LTGADEAKIRTWLTAEAVDGGVLGSIARPEPLIVGRYDARGRLRVASRTTARCPDPRAPNSAASWAHPWCRGQPATIGSSSSS